MKKEFEILVEKSIELMENETLSNYSEKITNDGRIYLLKELNLNLQNSFCWVNEIYKNYIVFEIEKKIDDLKNYHFAVNYSRNRSGEFEFSNYFEVDRITNYVPMKNYSVKKEEVSKPFPNEHAARQTEPSQYDSFRRNHPKGFPAGIDVIFGLKTVNGKTVSEIQTIRFKSDKWTPEKAKEWLKDHNFKTNLEVASKPVKKHIGYWIETDKSFWNGVI